MWIEFALHTAISLAIAWTIGILYESRTTIRTVMTGLFIFFIVLFPLMIMMAQSPLYTLSITEYTVWMIGQAIYLLSLYLLMRKMF
ncbi:hypothetical protein [Macrococcus hajekii]|uniref:hypothetical protein n=1 Tax=Macrococcus hajekii TaxID=198482 RepID=UPI00105F124D|nr:hypothetical protein [Macrococcus hajekii]